MSREVVFELNIADKPVGYAFGGKARVSVECPRCGRPALWLKDYRKQGERWTDYAHRIGYALNQKNEPDLVPGDVCHVGPPGKKTPDGSPAIAKRSVSRGAP